MSKIQRILVTGASGKLGGPLCRALLREQYHVTALRHRVPVDVDGVDEVTADLADAAAIEELVSRCDAVLHLATCKEDRDGVIDVSARGTFNLLEAARRTGGIQRFVLASGDAVMGIYFNRQPGPIREDMPLRAYPGYYPLSKVLEETMCEQYFYQEGLPTVSLRMSWIHAEDDLLNHLTVAGECWGIPVWRELMNDTQRQEFTDGKDAAVALRHPSGAPMRRHIVALEDCVQAFMLALRTPNVQGQTFNIAMDQPFDYVDTAEYIASQLDLEVLELVDPVGHDFCIDITKARYQLGYRPNCGIRELVNSAIQFRQSGSARRQRSDYRG